MCYIWHDIHARWGLGTGQMRSGNRPDEVCEQARWGLGTGRMRSVNRQDTFRQSLGYSFNTSYGWVLSRANSILSLINDQLFEVNTDDENWNKQNGAPFHPVPPTIVLLAVSCMLFVRVQRKVKVHSWCFTSISWLLQSGSRQPYITLSNYSH